jgi:hypothetical protein
VYDDSHGNLFAAADRRSPMTLFEARERAFEQMFVHDEEARFRALAQRNKLLGQWAATQLGLTGQKADAYVTEISQSLAARIIDDGLIEKLRADFAANGVNLSDDQIREKMSELMAVAVTQVHASEWRADTGPDAGASGAWDE